MALIDVLKWDNPGTFVAFKVGKERSKALRTMTQLIVNESQYAVFLANGQICDIFTAGRYTLTTNNLPLMSRIINMPFGGDSPFAAEVWFINRTVSLNLKFGTADPVTVEDPIYQIVVPVRAHGQFGLEVVDPGVFLQKLVGVAPAFDLPTTVEYFKGIMMSRLKCRISQAIVREKIGVLEIQAEMDNLSRNLEQAYAPDFAEYGLALRAFRVMSLSVRDDDPSVVMLKAAKARAAMRRIEGFTFAQERSFEVLQTGAANEGPGGAFASIGVGFGVGSAVGQMMRSSIGGVEGASAPAVPPPFPSSEQYYVHIAGMQRGPLVQSAMQEQILSGQISATTPAWKAGLTAWATVGQLPEFATLFSRPSGPLPPPFPGGSGGGL